MRLCLGPVNNSRVSEFCLKKKKKIGQNFWLIIEKKERNLEAIVWHELISNFWRIFKLNANIWKLEVRSQKEV